MQPPDLPQPISARAISPGAQLGVDREMISRVVYGFYDRIRADDRLGPIFAARIAEDRWPVHLETMVEFWSSVLLTTATYKGRPVPAHLNLPVEDAHFAHWLNLFEEVVDALCTKQVAALFMDRAERIASSLRYAIAMHNAPDGRPVFPAPLKREAV